MWNNLKFTAWVIFLVAVSMLVMTPMMPFISESAGVAATGVNSSVYASSYVGAEEAATYSPFFLYFVPPVVGIIAIVIKLKTSGRGD